TDVERLGLCPSVAPPGPPPVGSQSASSDHGESPPTRPPLTGARTVTRILHRLGYATAAHPWRTISAWVAFVVVAFGLASAFGGTTQDDYNIPAARAQVGIEQLRDHVPNGGGATAQVV